MRLIEKAISIEKLNNVKIKNKLKFIKGNCPKEYGVEFYPHINCVDKATPFSYCKECWSQQEVVGANFFVPVEEEAEIIYCGPSLQ